MRSAIIILIILFILSFYLIGSFYFKNVMKSEKQQAEGEKKQKQVAENVTVQNQTTQQAQQQQQTNQTNQTQPQQPTFQANLSASWCSLGGEEEVSSDIFGEGRGVKKNLGTEIIILGGNVTNKTFTCEACHTTLKFKLTDRTIEEWTNKPKLIVLGGNVATEECGKLVSSKTYLYTNKTGEEQELVFSNKTLVKEFWHDAEGKLCSITNSVLKVEKGAIC